MEFCGRIKGSECATYVHCCCPDADKTFGYVRMPRALLTFWLWFVHAYVRTVCMIYTTYSTYIIFTPFLTLGCTIGIEHDRYSKL